MAETPTTRDRGLLAVAAVSGLLYVALIFVPQVDGPSVETATAGQIRAFLKAHDTGIRMTATAGALSIPLVLVFSASLARMIRRRRDDTPLADVVVAAGVLVAMWHWVVVAASWMTLVQVLDGHDLSNVNDATLVGWYGLSNFAHLFADLGMCGIATLIAATSIASLRTGLFPRWLGWLGLVIAAGGGVGTVGITLAWIPLADVWFVGIFGWVVWTFLVAATCGMRLARGGRSARPSGVREGASLQPQA